MDTECLYCSSNVFDHDPVFVDEWENDERVEAGQFCNYACLTQYIEDEDLTAGAACRIDLG
jgi:hypothetical protein